jgi:hypothetical protein
MLREKVRNTQHRAGKPQVTRKGRKTEGDVLERTDEDNTRH